MSVSFVGAGSAPATVNAAGAISSIINYTVAGGASNVLVIIVFFSADPGAFTTMTWNSVAMSQIGTTQGNATDGFAAIFYLVNPASGSHTFNLVWTNTVAAAVYGQEFTGINTTTPLANLNSGTGTSSAPAVVVTTTSGDMACAGASIAGTNIASSNQTAAVSGQWDSAGYDADCRYGAASGSSVNCTWAAYGSDAWIAIGVDIQQASGGGGSGDVLMAQICM